MVIINEQLTMGKEIHMFANRIKNKINNDDQDALLIFGGDTGSGKSVAAMHFGYVIDKTISIDRICFDKDEFIKAIVGASKGQVVIADEAISIAFSRAAMTKDSRIIMELMAQIRQKNLCVIFCIPDVTMLDKAMQEKALAYIHVYENRGVQNKKSITIKGNQEVFLDLGKKKLKTNLFLHLRAVKTNPNTSIKKPKPIIRSKGNPIGKGFKKPFYPVDEKLYRAKKESILKKYIETDSPKEKRNVYQEKLVKACIRMRNAGLSYNSIREMTGLANATIMDYTKGKEINLKGTSSPVIPNL